ncbi:MAG TPA: hypothetical protein VIX86_27920 [Streptosporangiaceae bacterium]
MNHTPDTTTTAGNGGNFDPQQAAALLDKTTQRARRKLAPSPPWLLVIRAIMVLAACGAVWLSVRGQHPYRHPTAAVIPVIVTFVIVNFAATVAVARRATTGVSGKSRLRPAEIAVMAVAWVGSFVALGALAGTGVSRAFVYGLYPATVPLIVVGLAWAGIMAARAQWRACGTGLGVAVVGAVGLFAGPASVWLVMGIGLCAVLLGTAAAIAWQQRA